MGKTVCRVLLILATVMAAAVAASGPVSDPACAQTGPSSVALSPLDQALRQNNFANVRQLVLADVSGADVLFLSYLQDDLERPEPAAALRPLTLARRLAQAFRDLFDLDFEIGVVNSWTSFDRKRKEALLPLLREHFDLYREQRRADEGAFPRYGHDYRLVAGFRDLAQKYRAASFAVGELQARLQVCAFDPDEARKTWQLAKSLGDDVGEAWAAYHFGIWAAEDEPEAAARHAAEAARKLRLLRLLPEALSRLAWRAFNVEDLDGYVAFLRQGLEAARAIPVPEDMVGRAGHRSYPGEAWFLLTLWRFYQSKNDPQGEGLFERGRSLSRQYGGRTGELAYLIDATQRFIEQGLYPEVAAEAESLARELGDPAWLARFLMTKADGLLSTQKIPEAILAVEEADRLCQTIGSQGHHADCLFRRAIARTETSDFAAAETDFAQAIKIFRELDLIEKAASSGLEAGYFLRSRPKEASGFIDEALRDARRSGRPGLIAQALFRHGQSTLRDSPASSLQDFLDALPFAERAAQDSGIPGKSLGMMNNVSQALRRMGEFDRAIEIQEQRAARARTENVSMIEADALFRLQEIYSRDLGEADRAAEYVERYYALMTRPSRTMGVPDYNGVAAAFVNIGKTSRALETWATALKLARETPGGEYYQRVLHVNAGQVYLELGDYEAALGELEAEGGLIERTSDSSSMPLELQKASWLNKRALARWLAGDRERAIEDSRQAIDLEFKAPLGTVPASYVPYFTPGEALAMSGRYEEAADFFTRREERARQIGSPADQRMALAGLGLVWLKRGDLEKAREVLRRAVDLAKEPPGPQTGILADSLLALARVETAAGKSKEAEGLLIEARRTANPYDRDELWQISRELAGLLARTDRWDLARESFEAALGSLEQVRERLRPEEFSLRFGVDRLDVYDEFVGHLAERALRSGTRQDAETAFQQLERRRAQSLWDLLAAGWTRLPAEAMPEQLRRTRAAEERVVAKQSLLRQQFSLAPEKRNAALIRTLETGLEQARADHARLLSSVAQGTYRFARPAGAIADTAAKVQKSLGSDCALVEYFVSNESTYAFVLTSEDLRILRLQIGREELRRKTRSLVQPFVRLGRGEIDLTRVGFDLQGAHSLYQDIFAPLEPLLDGVHRLLVVPDDVLTCLPLEVLVDLPPNEPGPDATPSTAFEEAGFLIKRFAVSYLVSASSILVPADPRQPYALGHRLLALADPAARPNTPAQGPEDPFRRQLRSAALRRAFTPLPATTAEIERISRNFPRGSVALRSGAQATESLYKKESGSYEILHLATHAVASDSQPLYSALILAPDPAAGEDGFLQAYEVLRFPLRARLVVLSACETAMGPLGRGEGLVGLVSAFQQAGARSVLATHWTIDEAAVDLMDAFYAALMAGQPPGEALRSAKLKMMRKGLRLGGGGALSPAHPLFWAPFVLIGGSE